MKTGFLLAVLCLLPAEALAQPQKWAVVIGIGQYKDPAIRPLRYAVADARAVHDFLVDPKGGGFPKANVQLLLDQQTTQRALRSALGTTLARRAVKGDTVFIYYAGHGALEADLANREPDGYAKYLVPHDAEAKDLFASAINMAEVETFFSRIKAETVVFLLDTCYSGAGGGRGFANLPPGARDIQLRGDFLDRLVQGRGRAILTAADTNEVALELPELGHGLFTHHLLEGLRGKADSQGKGYVTLQDAYRYVYDRVARQSRQIGGNQNPKLIGQVVGEIVLATRLLTVAAVPSPATPEPQAKVVPRVGSLLIRSPRESVKLWLGKLAERPLGEAGPDADLVIENLQVGSHSLWAKARREGFKPIYQEIQIVANQRAEVVVNLEPLGPHLPPAEMYLMAYVDFRTGDYTQAIAGFREFIRRFPDSDLSDNAQYWVGEAYFSLAQTYASQGQPDKWGPALEQAAIEFRKVAVNYPLGDRAPGALYKEALALLELKQVSLAQARLEYLLARFPQSEEAPLARERLGALR